MPDVSHCSTLYHHLFGVGNIFKYFLINHVPAIGFASRLCRLIPHSRHNSWHELLENHCPSFSLVSITSVRGCEESRRRRRWSWHQDLAEDILPRLIRVTDRSETCWCAGQPLGRAERWRDDGASRQEHTHTDDRAKSNPHSFITLSVYLNCYALCCGLGRQTDTVHCLIILLVSCLACHILDKAANQMGGSLLPVSLGSLAVRLERT